MAIITSPENHKNLQKYKDIARRLALAEGLTDDQARQLARDGKAVVWIDGGLHATEVLGAQQLTETIYQLVSRTDEETMRFLRDVIILAVHANPDGMELVTDWYMRHKDPKQRTTSGIPRLYQKYIGHDNNRDFYMSAQPESTNMNRQLYHEWFPQIMYNHHQTGPTGTILFAPPFRDPANYAYHPLIITGPRHRRRRDAQPLRRRKQTGRDDAARRELLDVVERRPADDGVLPQHDRPAHRERSATRRRSKSRSCPIVRSRAPTCRSRSSRRSGTSGSRSSTRSPPTARCSTSRRATRSTSSSTSTRWARTPSTRARATTGRCTRSGFRR